MATVHFRNLDALRGLAAQVVLVSHVAALTLPWLAGSATDRFRGWAAQLAVIVFFALSGFVIAHSIRRHGDGDGGFRWFAFFVRRAARILPPLLLSMLFVGLVAALFRMFSLDGGVYDESASAWARSIVLLHRDTDVFAVLNGPVWSLRLEIGLYILAGIAAACWHAGGTRKIAMAICLVVFTAAFAWRMWFALPAILIFASGAIAALYGQRLAHLMWAALGICALLALLPVLSPQIIADILTSKLSLCHQTAFGISFGCALAGIAGRPIEVRGPIANLVFASGNWSYTLYIMHMPLIIALRAIAKPEGWLAFGFLLVLFNVLAAGIAKVVEQPDQFMRVFRFAVPAQNRKSHWK